MHKMWLTLPLRPPHAVKRPQRSQRAAHVGGIEALRGCSGFSQGPPDLCDSGVFYGPTLTQHSRAKDWRFALSCERRAGVMAKKEQSPQLLFDDCFTAGNDVARIPVAWGAHSRHFHTAGSPKLEGSRDRAREGILPHAVANVCTDVRPGMGCVRGRGSCAGLAWADYSGARQPAPSSWAPSHSQGGERGEGSPCQACHAV